MCWREERDANDALWLMWWREERNANDALIFESFVLFVLLFEHETANTNSNILNCT